VVDTSIESNSRTKSADRISYDKQAIAWHPPLSNETSSVWNHEVGWKDSGKPFSTGSSSVYQGFIETSSVWSDPRGVYALISYSEYEPDFYGYTKLYLNDGTEWAEIYSVDLISSTLHLSGISNGPQIFYGTAIACGIEFIENGERMCQIGMPSVDGLFVVHQELVYVVQGSHVIRYHNGKWLQFAELTKANSEEATNSSINSRAVWGNERFVVVVGDDGLISIYNPETAVFELQPNVPNKNYWKVWGFSERDIWVGSMDLSPGSLVHSNGEDWKIVWTEDNRCGGIRGMWGDRGILYFHTSNQFGFWDGEQIHIVAQVPCNSGVRFTGLWGNSDSEVFISVLKGNPENAINGEILVVWYDGSTLRLF